MNIAINPEAPEYVARITLKPKEDMKIVNRYHSARPVFSGTFVLAAWGVLMIAGLIMGTITI